MKCVNRITPLSGVRSTAPLARNSGFDAAGFERLLRAKIQFNILDFDGFPAFRASLQWLGRHYVANSALPCNGVTAFPGRFLRVAFSPCPVTVMVVSMSPSIMRASTSGAFDGAISVWQNAGDQCIEAIRRDNAQQHHHAEARYFSISDGRLDGFYFQPADQCVEMEVEVPSWEHRDGNQTAQ